MQEKYSFLSKYIHYTEILRKKSVGNYMFKVNNGNTKTRYEICLKLTIDQPERRYSVSINNFEQLNAEWKWSKDVLNIIRRERLID